MTFRIFLSAVAMILFAGTHNAHAEKIQLGYGVWAGGFQALDIALDLEFTPTTYTAKMTAKPSGLLGKLLPWAGDYISTGKIVHGELVPVTHEKTSAWRDDASHLKITYTNGVVTSLQRTENNKTVNEKINPKMVDASVDMVTGIVSMFRHATDVGDCDYSATAFDGKRRFTIQFKDKGTEVLPKSKRNIFSNAEARACQLELKPLLGFKDKPRGYYKIQEDARKQGALPTVWLGRLAEGNPYVPVRMLVKSEYGAVFIHLEKMKQK